MPEFEFDVDASIAAGWERFAGHLAGLLRALEPGVSFDMTVPALGTSPPESPYLRFTRPAAGRLYADVFGGGDAASPVPLSGEYLDRLDSLGWTARASTAHVTMSADHARTIARLVSIPRWRSSGSRTRCSSTTRRARPRTLPWTPTRTAIRGPTTWTSGRCPSAVRTRRPGPSVPRSRRCTRARC